MMVGFWNLNKLRSEMFFLSEREREIGMSCLRFVVQTRFSSCGILVSIQFSVRGNELYYHMPEMSMPMQFFSLFTSPNTLRLFDSLRSFLLLPEITSIISHSRLSFVQ